MIIIKDILFFCIVIVWIPIVLFSEAFKTMFTLLNLLSLLISVAKSGIVESLLTWADFKQSKELKKTDGAKRQRITGITKLEDANDAGGRNSDKCTLILTEGDSAKALAVDFFQCR